MKRVFCLVMLLLLPHVIAEEFPPQNPNYGFVGWAEGESEVLGQYSVSYPSISDGDDQPMAQNGPFAVVLFQPDGDESIEQYTWIQEKLTLWGYIVVVKEKATWNLSEIIAEVDSWNVDPLVQGSEGMVDVEHMAIGGHGTGAFHAAEMARYWSENLSGIFGLSLDGDGTEQAIVELSAPSVALFLTGTTDQITPASENAQLYLESWPGAWQLMFPLGANHIGYQNTDTFLERFVDGDQTMSRDDQQEHAANHILPYLNLTLRGDDSAYQEAFNREDKSVSTDESSYIDEDLTWSKLYAMEELSSSLDVVMMNQSFVLSSNVTMRNGSPAIGNVTCVLPDSPDVPGIMINGTASCDLLGSMLEPGDAEIMMHIADYSFSSWMNITIQRIGDPMVLVEPLPDAILDQRSSVTMTPGQFASDPDQVIIQFAEIELLDDADGNLSMTWNSSSFTISHVKDSEYSGNSTLNITLIAGDDDVAEISVQVLTLPVDDQVLQFATIPQQQADEDGESMVIELSQYIRDPEGGELVVEQSLEYEGIRVEILGSKVLVDPQTNWNGAELLKLFVSDGTTEAIEITVPVNIAPVNDPIVFLDDEYTVEFDEDDAVLLSLLDLVDDVDGEAETLQFTIEGESEVLGFSMSGLELSLAGKPNQFGSSTLTMTVSDGSSNDTMDLIVNIQSVPDLPTVAINSLTADDYTVTLLWTINDKDGPDNLLHSINFDGNDVMAADTECTGIEVQTCATYIDRSAGMSGWYTLEVKVYDNYAQTWSNTATQNVELQELKQIEQVDESEGLGDWVLPVGLGAIVLLLVIVLFTTRK